MKSQKSLEFCLLDAGIKTMRDLKFPDTIISLNLHCNEIEMIENISCLENLKYLDLSSNHITKMSGISKCTSLQRLNLACNQIQVVECMEYLT